MQCARWRPEVTIHWQHELKRATTMSSFDLAARVANMARKSISLRACVNIISLSPGRCRQLVGSGGGGAHLWPPLHHGAWRLCTVGCAPCRTRDGLRAARAARARCRCDGRKTHAHQCALPTVSFSRWKCATQSAGCSMERCTRGGTTLQP